MTVNRIKYNIIIVINLENNKTSNSINVLKNIALNNFNILSLTALINTCRILYYRIVEFSLILGIMCQSPTRLILS